MHGILFTELRKYVSVKFGKAAWDDLLKNAGLGTKRFMPFDVYPDDEMALLVEKASTMTGQPAADILEDFGVFITPDLLLMYQGLVQPEWRTLDVIEHTEAVIHTVVREQKPGAQPPELVSQRLNADEVMITYGSSRKMCAVAKGIIKGLAEHYKEKVAITESSCMLEGGSNCVISVKSLKSF